MEPANACESGFDFRRNGREFCGTVRFMGYGPRTGTSLASSFHKMEALGTRDGELDISGQTCMDSGPACLHRFRGSHALADGICLFGKHGCDFPRLKLAFEGMTQAAGCVCVFIEGGFLGGTGELVKDKHTRRSHVFTLPELQEMGYRRVSTRFHEHVLTWRVPSDQSSDDTSY